MRAILAISLITLIALFGCDGRDLEGELNAANAEIRRLRGQVREAERRTVESEAKVSEYRARGYPVSSLTLTVTLECYALPGREPEQVRAAGTVIDLIRSNGDRWRLPDDMGPPQMESSSPGVYSLTLNYRPDPGRAATIVGQDVATLAEVGTLALRMRGVLAAMGLELAPSGVTRLAIEVNGITVVDAYGLGAPSAPDGESFQAIDVSRQFAAIPENYFASLEQRARDRIAR